MRWKSVACTLLLLLPAAARAQTEYTNTALGKLGQIVQQMQDAMIEVDYLKLVANALKTEGTMLEGLNASLNADLDSYNHDCRGVTIAEDQRASFEAACNARQTILNQKIDDCNARQNDVKQRHDQALSRFRDLEKNVTDLGAQADRLVAELLTLPYMNAAQCRKTDVLEDDVACFREAYRQKYNGEPVAEPLGDPGAVTHPHWSVSRGNRELPTDPPSHWNQVETGDYPGADRAQSPGFLPQDSFCTADHAGEVAICWDGAIYNNSNQDRQTFCTYKTITVGQIIHNGMTGVVYVCRP
jgi:Skp family chaperone for outer membrane proteins